ncbi:MAG TPA: biotin transporter BioY [Sedimentisphaerales bacterium]|nr:biotin transporter BioY [Sedimentisphaerales bacterium]
MERNLTYADLLVPCEKKKALVVNAAVVIGASWLLALSAQVSFYVPFSVVPVTAQTFAVLMIAAMLGSGRGSFAVLTYIAQGAMGLPVFAMGKAGAWVLFGPTGGYLVGFAAAAMIVGRLAEMGWDRSVLKTAAAMTLGTLAIYTFGVFWLTVLTGSLQSALVAGLYPFIAACVFEVIAAVAVLPAGWKLLNKAGFGK